MRSTTAHARRSRTVLTRPTIARFAIVRAIGLTLPGVVAATKYDGSPVLKVNGKFMAGLASHVSAEPDTLVVRYSVEEREWLLDEAPDIYYLTDFYRAYPLVLVRLGQVTREALHDLLSVSRRLTLTSRSASGGILS